jgi:HTH-like domain/Integrase core domain
VTGQEKGGEGQQVRELSRRVAQLEAEAEIARRLAGFSSPGSERERIYRFIESEAGRFAVRTLCRVAQVSSSAYYAWRARGEGPSEALIDEAHLANRIFDIWRRSRSRYGAPRITAALVKAGVKLNEKRVARLMAELGIAGKCGRRKLRTTWRDKKATPAADMVQRDFTADQPDELWVGDVTYIPTSEGWLFVASVLDVCTRMIVGWSIADHLRTELCSDAMAAAAATRGRRSFGGTVFHSDHGCQGGFNWWSQHLVGGGVHGTRVGMGGGEGGSPGGAQDEPPEGCAHISGSDPFTGGADGGVAGRPGSVLGSDSSRCENRGRRGRGGGVIPRRVPVVPSRWRREPLSSSDSFWPISVLR